MLCGTYPHANVLSTDTLVHPNGQGLHTYRLRVTLSAGGRCVGPIWAELGQFGAHLVVVWWAPTVSPDIYRCLIRLCKPDYLCNLREMASDMPQSRTFEIPPFSRISWGHLVHGPVPPRTPPNTPPHTGPPLKHPHPHICKNGECFGKLNCTNALDNRRRLHGQPVLHERTRGRHKTAAPASEHQKHPPTPHK